MNSDFDDNFGGPPDGYGLHAAGPDPLLIMLLIVLVVVIAGCIALVLHLGRQRGLRRLEAERKASALAIYDSVRFHLDNALQSPGGAMLERGREVADVLEARLGFVLALNARPGKLIDALDKALNGDRPKPPPDPAKARVKTALPTESHYLEVWRALQALSRVWDDKPRILALIEAAQTELCERPHEVRSRKGAHRAGPAAVAAVVEAALDDANRAAGGPVASGPPAEAESAEPDPEPTPPKPRKKREKPPKRDKGDGDGGRRSKAELPPHKRNMLA